MLRICLVYVAAALTVTSCASAARADAQPDRRLAFGRFDTVAVYMPVQPATRVVLFLSGDGGWERGVTDMARALSRHGALVVGINTTRYVRALERADEPCSYPASDFELLSKYVQKACDFPEYIPPVLAGYSSGATLVYATLAQAPATEFLGGISLGFGPEWPELTKPFCRGTNLQWKAGPGAKGYTFLPARGLEVPWILLHGTDDKVCDFGEARAFAAQVPKASFVGLPGVGHGYANQGRWEPKLLNALETVAPVAALPAPAPHSGGAGRSAPREMGQASVPDVGDLPLTEVSAIANDAHRDFAVFLTGDGGYGVTDKGVSEALAAAGVPVVVLNDLKYFWNRRTPPEMADALERVLEHYSAVWHRDRAVVIGYSLGADVLPFMLTRLSDASRQRVRAVALLGPSHSVDFQFHVADWLGNATHSTDVQTRPELLKLHGLDIVCFCGQDDSDCLCRDLPAGVVRSVELPGGHRIRGRYGPVADEVLRLAH